MSNDDKEANKLTKTTTQDLDGFTGFEDGVEGDDKPQSGSVIHGRIIKFTNEFDYVTNDGEELSPTLELVAVDIIRLVQKWVNQKPEETIVVPPGQKFPDIEALNEKSSRTEWRKDLNDRMVGPWQMQYLVYLLDLQTLDRYTFATATIGGGIAVRAAMDRAAHAGDAHDRNHARGDPARGGTQTALAQRRGAGGHQRCDGRPQRQELQEKSSVS